MNVSAMVRNLSFTEVFPTLTRTADANSGAVDTRDYEGHLGFLLSSTRASASDDLNVKIQESANGTSGWTDVTGAAFTEVTATADSTQTLYIEKNAVKRYLRAVGDVTGSSVSISYSVHMFGYKREI